MVARILVAVLLSLAGAPVLQADSLDDFCESRRLRLLAFERWAEEIQAAPESVQFRNRGLIAQGLEDSAKVICGDDDARARARRVWMSPGTSSTTLSMMYHRLAHLEDMADARVGLTSRQMSVETLLLFAEARIYAIRAFTVALEVAASR